MQRHARILVAVLLVLTHAMAPSWHRWQRSRDRLEDGVVYRCCLVGSTGAVGSTEVARDRATGSDPDSERERSGRPGARLADCGIGLLLQNQPAFDGMSAPLSVPSQRLCGGLSAPRVSRVRLHAHPVPAARAPPRLLD